MIKNVYRCSGKVPVIVVRLSLEFFQQVFEKLPNIKYHGNPPKREPSCSVRADGRTDMTKPALASKTDTQ